MKNESVTITATSRQIIIFMRILTLRRTRMIRGIKNAKKKKTQNKSHDNEKKKNDDHDT